MKPDQSEIDDVINECAEHENSGTSKYSGMTYEQGVKAAIEWLTDGGTNPMAD